MKDCVNKKNEGKVKKMTLSGYYQALPDISPRLAFVRKVAKEAGVTEVSVVGWCKGRKPHKYEHVICLAKHSGIKPEDLWER